MITSACNSAKGVFNGGLLHLCKKGTSQCQKYNMFNNQVKFRADPHYQYLSIDKYTWTCI
jgi:hypothetical protein